VNGYWSPALLAGLPPALAPSRMMVVPGFSGRGRSGWVAGTWARAGGMKTAVGLPLCGSATIPMTLKLGPAILIFEPVFNLCDFAYPESTTATFEVASELLSERPEVILPALSGPSER